MCFIHTATDFTRSTLAMFPALLLGNSKHTAVSDITMRVEDDEALKFSSLLVQ